MLIHKQFIYYTTTTTNKYTITQEIYYNSRLPWVILSYDKNIIIY